MNKRNDNKLFVIIYKLFSIVVIILLYKFWYNNIEIKYKIT